MDSQFRSQSQAVVIASPNQLIQVVVKLTKHGQLVYQVSFQMSDQADDQFCDQSRCVVRPSRLGLIREDVAWDEGLSWVKVSEPTVVDDSYELLTSKKRLARYVANRQSVTVANAQGGWLEVVFQVSDDGVAFCYVMHESGEGVGGACGALKVSPRDYVVIDELTTFDLGPQALGWLQPIAEAKTGWAKTNPSYEEYYLRGVPVGAVNPNQVDGQKQISWPGWVYPALFRTANQDDAPWVLISEAGFNRDYGGTRLVDQCADGLSNDRGGIYKVGFADERECFSGGGVLPRLNQLPWQTPWRVLVIGDLATVVQSTLGVDVAEGPSASTMQLLESQAPIELGKSSWSWPLLGDSHTTFEVQKRFIDYAADMKWRYCLIDAQWDQQIGDAKLKQLVGHAASQQVKILVWYNSAGDWNETFQTPRSKLLTREDRLAEFEKLKQMGVAGLKIDFFAGDGQSMFAYYEDILIDALPYGFVMNFHGCTLPRGLHKKYPHLMTMESVRGLEYVTFDQANANQVAAHCAMLPYTRNVFDPMDFTPMVLDQIPGIDRKTSSGFELALSVLLTSGIQHYAEIPEGMAKAPEYVVSFLRQVPSIWEQVVFLDGFPGESVVLARLGVPAGLIGDGLCQPKWFIAGIYAGCGMKTFELDLSKLLGVKPGDQGFWITDADGNNLSFKRESVVVGEQMKWCFQLHTNCGFVMVL